MLTAPRRAPSMPSAAGLRANPVATSIKPTLTPRSIVQPRHIPTVINRVPSPITVTPSAKSPPMTDDGHVKILVRIRPYSAAEASEDRPATNIVGDDGREAVVGPNDGAVCHASPSTSITAAGKRFSFDGVFTSSFDTATIYSTSLRPIVLNDFRGLKLNCSILAYGQTGTGKTFTIDGLLPLLLGDVFSKSATMVVPTPTPITTQATPRAISSAGSAAPVRPDTASPATSIAAATTTTQPNQGQSASPLKPISRLMVSYVEVYGDSVFDLLIPTATDGGAAVSLKALPVYEGPEGAISMPATRVACAAVSDVLEVISAGNALRSVAATNMNSASSRSHCILTLENADTKAKLTVVDLAGSERNKKTGNVGERLKESIAINQGLLALGNVVRALAASSQAAAASTADAAATHHIPYRSSKLTRILQDCVCPNARTAFIACVSPAAASSDETVRTLQYCSKATKIVQAPRPNLYQPPAAAGTFAPSLKAGAGDRRRANSAQVQRAGQVATNETIGEGANRQLRALSAQAVRDSVDGYHDDDSTFSVHYTGNALRSERHAAGGGTFNNVSKIRLSGEELGAKVREERDRIERAVRERRLAGNPLDVSVLTNYGAINAAAYAKGASQAAVALAKYHQHATHLGPHEDAIGSLGIGLEAIDRQQHALQQHNLKMLLTLKRELTEERRRRVKAAEELEAARHELKEDEQAFAAMLQDLRSVRKEKKSLEEQLKAVEAERNKAPSPSPTPTPQVMVSGGMVAAAVLGLAANIATPSSASQQHLGNTFATLSELSGGVLSPSGIGAVQSSTAEHTLLSAHRKDAPLRPQPLRIDTTEPQQQQDEQAPLIPTPSPLAPQLLDKMRSAARSPLTAAHLTAAGAPSIQQREEAAEVARQRLKSLVAGVPALPQSKSHTAPAHSNSHSISRNLTFGISPSSFGGISPMSATAPTPNTEGHISSSSGSEAKVATKPIVNKVNSVASPATHQLPPPIVGSEDVAAMASSIAPHQTNAAYAAELAEADVVRSDSRGAMDDASRPILLSELLSDSSYHVLRDDSMAVDESYQHTASTAQPRPLPMIIIPPQAPHPLSQTTSPSNTNRVLAFESEEKATARALFNSVSSSSGAQHLRVASSARTKAMDPTTTNIVRRDSQKSGRNQQQQPNVGNSLTSSNCFASLRPLTSASVKERERERSREVAQKQLLMLQQASLARSKSSVGTTEATQQPNAAATGHNTRYLVGAQRHEVIPKVPSFGGSSMGTTTTLAPSASGMQGGAPAAAASLLTYRQPDIQRVSSFGTILNTTTATTNNLTAPTANANQFPSNASLRTETNIKLFASQSTLGRGEDDEEEMGSPSNVLRTKSGLEPRVQAAAESSGIAPTRPVPAPSSDAHTYPRVIVAEPVSLVNSASTSIVQRAPATRAVGSNYGHPSAVDPRQPQPNTTMNMDRTMHSDSAVDLLQSEEDEGLPYTIQQWSPHGGGGGQAGDAVDSSTYFVPVPKQHILGSGMNGPYSPYHYEGGRYDVYDHSVYAAPDQTSEAAPTASSMASGSFQITTYHQQDHVSNGRQVKLPAQQPEANPLLRVATNAHNNAINIQRGSEKEGAAKRQQELVQSSGYHNQQWEHQHPPDALIISPSLLGSRSNSQPVVGQHVGRAPQQNGAPANRYLPLKYTNPNSSILSSINNSRPATATLLHQQQQQNQQQTAFQQPYQYRQPPPLKSPQRVVEATQIPIIAQVPSQPQPIHNPQHSARALATATRRWDVSDMDDSCGGRGMTWDWVVEQQQWGEHTRTTGGKVVGPAGTTMVGRSVVPVEEITLHDPAVKDNRGGTFGHRAQQHASVKMVREVIEYTAAPSPGRNYNGYNREEEYSPALTEVRPYVNLAPSNVPPLNFQYALKAEGASSSTYSMSHRDPATEELIRQNVQLTAHLEAIQRQLAEVEDY